MDTTLRKVLIYCERLPPLKTRLFDHVINDTSHDIEKPVFNFTRLMATKLDRVLNLGRKLSMQMFKSPPSPFYDIKYVICK